ncbi:MAG: hypothetical protein ACRCZF_02435, partial [Gemmataceae bacterium]
VHDPREILAAAYELLIPGGKLIIACPNIESLPFQWFGPAWFGLDLPRHLNHFSPATLQEMLCLCGYTVETIRGIRHSDWFRASARLSARQNTMLSWQKLLTWKPLARIAAATSYFLGQSDCMIVIAERPGLSV